MADLYPVFDVPTILEETETSENLFKESAYFDFETGDFRMSGSGKVQRADGYESWKQWCIKTIMTQRAAFLAYTENLGIDGEQALAELTEAKQQLAFETTITAALLADPYGRTMEVRNFQWTRPGPDSLAMTCEVVGQDDRTAKVGAAWTA